MNLYLHTYILNLIYSYHSGVQIDDREYTFAAESGVFYHPPRRVPNGKFRERFHMFIFSEMV